MPRFAIVEAPSVLGLKQTGVETSPQAMLDEGLARRIGARRAGSVAPGTPYDPRVDPRTKMLNPNGIARYSVQLADALGPVLDNGEFPVILGGDCSILLGSMLALKRRGRYGLLFIDGHADFYQPDADPTGEAASMELALATGRGPRVVTDLEGRGPLIRDEDVVAFGFRDTEEQKEHGSQPLPPNLLAMDLAEVRSRGVEWAATAAVTHLTRGDGPEGGFFVHLDADVLDDAIMPAVDYRMPGGLQWQELGTVLRIALDSPQVVGAEVTIYNARLDLDGAGRRGLVDTLADALCA